MKQLDVAIIGGGPAGMAAALMLHKSGIGSVRLFERQPRLGGVLQQCIHYGFGLEYFSADLTGPEFAQRQIEDLERAGIDCSVQAMVTSIGQRKLEVYSEDCGHEQYDCRAVILATGCRERTRENLDIPGSRPAGIFMAGQVQALINLQGVLPGKKVILQGSGDIGLIIARRLALSGVEVIGVCERLSHLSGLLRNKVQCLDHFDIPLHLNSRICQIYGRQRVEAVDVCDAVTGTIRTISCDTVLVAAGLIPEIELFLQAGGVSEHGSPIMRAGYESRLPGVFLAGNALHINDLADNAALEGEACAQQVIQYLNGRLTDAYPPAYLVKQKDCRFTEDFFRNEELGKAVVCIRCPKSCMLTDEFQGCDNGSVYWKRVRQGRFQRVTRTRVQPGRIVLETTPEVDLKTLSVTPYAEKLVMQERIRRSEQRHL